MSNTKTEAQRLADWLDADACDLSTPREAAAELLRLDALCEERGANLAKLIMRASEMQDMLDWLKTENDQLRAQLAKAVAEEREACAELMEQQHTWITNIAASAAIRARSNT